MIVKYTLSETINGYLASKEYALALGLVYHEGIYSFSDNLNLQDAADCIIMELAKFDARISTGFGLKLSLSKLSK